MAAKSAMVRLYDVDKDYFEKLAEERGEPVTRVIHSLVEEHRQKSFWACMKQQVSAVKSNPEVWNEIVAERELWDNTLSEGNES